MLQRQLLIDYESDVRKYAQGLDQAKIINVYRSVPAQLAKENKKFQYSLVEKGGRSKDYMGCIDWLSDAGLINICRCMSFPSLPLKGNTDGSKFKVYVADTGLLVASLDDEAQEDLRANQNLGIYKGALYENFAAEALIKQGYDLYYYKKDNSTLKEDFSWLKLLSTKESSCPTGKSLMKSQTSSRKNSLGKTLMTFPTKWLTKFLITDMLLSARFLAAHLSRQKTLSLLQWVMVHLLTNYLARTA